MFNFLKRLLQKVHSLGSYQERLNQYIVDRAPTTPAEVEYLIREFDRRNGGHYA